jgi:hypothetical protein
MIALYLLLGAGLVHHLEHARPDLRADVGEAAVGLQSLNDEVLEFVELLHI